MGTRECPTCHGKLCVSKVPIFQNLSEEEMVKVARKIQHKTYEKGEVIFVEGTPSRVLYFVNLGKTKLYKYTKDGKEQILHILKPGDFLGELNLLTPSIHKFHAKAMEPVTLCMLKKEEMATILMENPSIAIKLLETVGKRLEAAESLAQNLATNDVDARLAHLILTFLSDEQRNQTSTLEITLPLSREEMANSIGVTRETISRKLKKLEEDNLIELVGTKKIKILNYEGLEEYI